MPDTPECCIPVLAPPGTPPVPRVVVPSWVDSRFAQVTGETEISEQMAVLPGPPTKVRGDAMRWLIGFMTKKTNTAVVRVSPHPDPENWPWIEMGAGLMFSWALMAVGPVVTHEWYLWSSAPNFVRMVESRTR